MGIWYAGVMLYGIELTSDQLSKIVRKLKSIEDEDEIDNFLSDYGIDEIEFPEGLCGTSLSYSYDGDMHMFLAIKSTYHQSEIYEGTKIKERFQVDYEQFDRILSEMIGKKVKGNWYIMPHGY